MALDVDVEYLKKNDFYSPLCRSGYLTPLQRKKLREKRKCETFLSQETETKVPKSLKGIKKQKLRKCQEVKTKALKILLEKPVVKENCYSVSDLVTQGKAGSSKEKRFFKFRSPQHLKKAKFSMPLKYKGNRLDFNSGKNTISTKSKYIVPISYAPVMPIKENETLTTSLNDLNIDENLPPPTIIKISNDTSPIVLTTKDSADKAENDYIISSIEEDPFGFDLELDKVLLERQVRARAEARKRLSELEAKSASNGENSAEKTDSSGIQSSPKYYPIFTKMDTEAKTPNKAKKSSSKRSLIKDTSKGDEQMIIDAGQKEIGAKQCKTCNMIYTIGTEADLHAKYHDTFLINLKFPGWKNEQIIGQFDDGRVIQVNETDKHMKLKKVEEVLFIANRDLGFPTAGFPVRPNLIFLLFVSNAKRVEGCLVAESIDSACPVVLSDASTGVYEDDKRIWKLGNWYASSEKVPAICGINRIWVSFEFRRQKVASRMVDCLRQNFLYGYVIGMHELAFTDPSPVGREFAASYTGTDHFLVYK